MIIGSAEWEARQGRLDAVDRWRYALEAVRTRLGLLAGSWLSRDRRRQLQRVDLDRVLRPDSACARAAVEKLESLSTPALAHHCHRTYLWGALLGQLDGRRCDPELLFVSAMLHDLGLTETAHGSCREAQCFTLDGVHAARDVFASTTPDRAERMRRAILLHLNSRVPGEVFGWEAHYLQAGAAFDIVGQRYRELPRPAVHTTLARHPRLGLKDEILAWSHREEQLRPHSRMAVLNRLGFRALVRAAPFAA